MSEKEYIVTLNKGVDYAQFNQEMIASTGAGDIPNRTVDVANSRPGSARNTHYALTEDEVTALKNDPRVLDIGIPPDQDDSIEIGIQTRYEGTFYKGTAESGQVIDWGKRRHSIQQETVTWSTSLAGAYDYVLDGTGVDVVIQDSGLQVDHPEFTDAFGASRVHQINWATESGLSFTQSANHYRDYDGHGTHVAGTAAGKTFGWAKNSRVYAVKVAGLEGSGDSGSGISVSNCFDCIKLWHRNKPVDPITGKKRPTIVNMSWGYSAGLGSSTNITSISYRGSTYNSSNDSNWASDLSSGSVGRAHMLSTYGLNAYLTNNGYRVPVRVTSVDTDVQELIDEGIHVCIAAGNNSFKVDVSGGDDYNNIVFFSGSNRAYHQGSSPYSDEAFMVGSLLAQSNTADSKVSFSTTGPGVDIYAAGDEITSACSTTTRFTSAAYWGDNNFKQCNIQGTSMASPQICGIGAMYLQANPGLSPAELRTMIHNDAFEGMPAGTLTGYSDSSTVIGGPRRVAVSRYAKRIPFSSTASGKYSIRSK